MSTEAEAVSTEAEAVGADDRTEALRVSLWRQAELERAGWPPVEALRIADRHDIDLHDACELVRQGCPPERALDILL